MKVPHQAADVKRQQFLTDEADDVIAGSFLKSLKLNQTHVFSYILTSQHRTVTVCISILIRM